MDGVLPLKMRLTAHSLTALEAMANIPKNAVKIGEYGVNFFKKHWDRNRNCGVQMDNVQLQLSELQLVLPQGGIKMSHKGTWIARHGTFDRTKCT